MKTIGSGPKPRTKLDIRKIVAGIAGLAVLLAAIALILAGTKDRSETQVKLRYDGQTYPGKTSAGSDRYSNKSDMFEMDYGASAGIDGAPALGGAANSMDSAMPPENSPDSATGNGSQSSVGQHGKKIAYYYDFTAETTEFDEFVRALDVHVSSAGGYMESSSVDTREYEIVGGTGTRTVRLGRYSFRLPADEAAEFKSFLDGGGAGVLRSDVSMVDRTEAYADAELQVRSYRAEYEKLEAMIPYASSVDELIQIQDRLSSLNYQIQWQEKQKDLIDEDVEMSSVDLTVYEVLYYTATVESYRFRMGERVAEALDGFLYAMPEFLFAMVYFMLAGFVAIGLCSVLFRVLFNIRNRKSRDQIVRIVRDEIRESNKEE